MLKIYCTLETLKFWVNAIWKDKKSAIFHCWLPVVSLFQSFVFVWKSVKLHPDDDGHIGDTVLSVEAVPAGVANKVVARYLKQMIFLLKGEQLTRKTYKRVLKACHHPWARGKLFHSVDMLLDIRENELMWTLAYRCKVQIHKLKKINSLWYINYLVCKKIMP